MKCIGIFFLDHAFNALKVMRGLFVELEGCGLVMGKASPTSIGGDEEIRPSDMQRCQQTPSHRKVIIQPCTPLSFYSGGSWNLRLICERKLALSLEAPNGDKIMTSLRNA